MNTSVELRRALDRVGSRFRRVRLWGSLAVCWAVFAIAAAMVGLAVGSDAAAARVIAVSAAVSAAVAGMVCWLVAEQRGRDPRWVARRVEASNPDLSAVLLAAVEQEPTPDGRLGFLQASVIDSALAHSRTHDWDAAVPRRRLNLLRLSHWVALALLVGVVSWLGVRALPPVVANVADLVGSTGAAGMAVEVQPGTTQIERGTPLLVVARFPGEVPGECALVVEGGETRPMTRNLDDPTFAGHVPTVNADLAYRVEFPGGRSDTFHVTVYEHPELKRVNARLVFPPFAGMDPKEVQDVRHVTAVEGTDATLFCQLNKEVVRAVLVDEKGREQPIVPNDPANHEYRVTIKLTESQRYAVKLTDVDGRNNKLPSEISVRVTSNLPPVVKVTRPGRDSRVSPIEELPLKAEVKDDYGLVRFGVSVAAGGQPPVEVVLGEPTAAPPLKKAQPDHLIDFEALKAQPDQVVSYYFWAEDVGPDGNRRRTSGDMYFAEVRHFEEIFRQGQQQTREQQEREQQQREQQQGQGGNAEAADQLAELQKQIVSATWGLIRREIEPKPTEKYAEDVKLVGETQHSVIEKANALGGQLQAPESIEHLQQAIRLMTDAGRRLTEATEPPTPANLPAALSAEQAAYQALLKLRAREYEVSRQNSRQRQSSQSSRNSSRSPSQQQLRQLDLADEQNRYETQSTARAQQERQAQRDQEQRENLELADRLKELARRQNDLTDRVKELQSALEQAKDDQKREELEQQLKRLRDQQQQLLRDTDELQQRMENEQNRDRLSEAREQVEQSRENVRQASEALQNGQLSQAVNEGTRAGRQLDQAREQVRRDTANRFGEEMRDMRQQARQLDEDQKKLTTQLEEMDKKPAAGLRDGNKKEEVRTGLDQQKQKLDKLTERMQQTVQEAEKTEPRLAQELYDAARGTAERRVGETLDIARRLAEAGVTPDAAGASRLAGQGLEQLRQGVEKAAESVLGGQTDDLKLAQRELTDLSNQLNNEINRATGQQPGEERGGRRPGEPQQPGQQPGERQPGQQPGERQPGQQPGQQGQPGERQPGGGQPGQQPQPGERQPGQQGQPGERQPGQQQPREGQSGQGQPGQQPGQQGQPGERQPGQGQPGGQPRRSLNDPSGQQDRNRQPGGEARGGQRTETGQPNGRGGPIREEGFRDWFDRMRATEDLIDDPQLRAEAARIRERVRSAREEFKRHSKEPDWTKLQDMVAKPLDELRNRVAEEVRRREAPNSLVPIDRDPVPPEFVDGVRRYYERLGSGR